MWSGSADPFLQTSFTSADFRLLALQWSLHDRENSKAAVGLAFGHLSDISKSLVCRIIKHWHAPFLQSFCPAHLLGSAPSPIVYTHCTKPVAFKQLSALVTEGFAAGLPLMYLRQLKQESFLPLVKSCTLKQNTWNKIPQAVLFLFHDTLVLLV